MRDTIINSKYIQVRRYHDDACIHFIASKINTYDLYSHMQSVKNTRTTTVLFHVNLTCLLDDYILL